MSWSSHPRHHSNMMSLARITGTRYAQSLQKLYLSSYVCRPDRHGAFIFPAFFILPDPHSSKNLIQLIDPRNRQEVICRWTRGSLVWSQGSCDDFLWLSRPDGCWSGARVSFNFCFLFFCFCCWSCFAFVKPRRDIDCSAAAKPFTTNSFAFILVDFHYFRSLMH